ncbi:hypothetical protein LJY25_07965 [Hymenobacter sp. BT175]|uniref:hypothetical protein n=1 Tax=Hymenobacter translucens TaxID=2886507 RepID=UPI001D0DF923|nr:hypothetical protein [Hymenobacter translucens]MCC2546377.1 hypothetical protein [Hymenobacter translucens]
MKKLPPALAALGLLLSTSCQQQAAPTQATAKAETAAPVRTVTTQAARPVEPAPVLSPEMLAFLKQHDLTTLWPKVSSGSYYNPVQNGFFGADHYRIEVVFTRVVQDSVHPGILHVTGKNRFKKTITPFSGEIILDQLQDAAFENHDAENPAYSARGSFVLREDPQQKNAGVFTGKVTLDFRLYPNEEQILRLSHSMAPEGYAARGGGATFEGEWVNNASGQRKPCIWADDFFMVANTILRDFAIAERDVTINPQYVHLGWDKYWENDEWYAEAAALTAQATIDSIYDNAARKAASQVN